MLQFLSLLMHNTKNKILKKKKYIQKFCSVLLQKVSPPEITLQQKKNFTWKYLENT